MNGQKVNFALESVGKWVLEIRIMPEKSKNSLRMLVLSGFPERGTVSQYLNGVLMKDYEVPVYGNRQSTGPPGRAIFVDYANTKLYYLESKASNINDTICEVSLPSDQEELRRLSLPFNAWSMCLNPYNCDIYAMSLDGKICRMLGNDPSQRTETTLEYSHPLFKSEFPTINFVKELLIVVGYLKTPKDDDSCPNRVFIIFPDLRIKATIDVTIQGSIFCKRE